MRSFILLIACAFTSFSAQADVVKAKTSSTAPTAPASVNGERRFQFEARGPLAAVQEESESEAKRCATVYAMKDCEFASQLKRGTRCQINEAMSTCTSQVTDGKSQAKCAIVVENVKAEGTKAPVPHKHEKEAECAALNGTWKAKIRFARYEYKGKCDAYMALIEEFEMKRGTPGWKSIEIDKAQEAVRRRQPSVTVGDVEIGTRICDGKYPNWCC